MMHEIYTENTIIINPSTFENFRKNLKTERAKNPRKKIGFTSTDDKLNRKILEKENVDIFMPLLQNRKDFQKQRNSGFNQVLAKIAKKRDIVIGIFLDEIISSKGKGKIEILARIKQNIKLCNKNKLKMKFYGKNKRNIYDLKSLGLVLGMPTWIVKNL